MMHFNPLNIVNLGGNKIQHPEQTHSNTISRNVEAAYKEFLTFQSKLKNLVMLYKTRHQLIDSLNENGLYTARCYDEIFHDTPLSLVLAPGRQTPSSPQPPVSSPEDEREHTPVQSELENHNIDDNIDTTEYPCTAYSRRTLLDADEGSIMVGKHMSKHTDAKDPEGIKASLYTSISASASESESETRVSQNSPKRRQRFDPPSKAFPDDEIDAIFEKNRTQMESNELGDNVNFIVDNSEDSFINDRVWAEKNPRVVDDNDNYNDFAAIEPSDIENTNLNEPVTDSVESTDEVVVTLPEDTLNEHVSTLSCEDTNSPDNESNEHNNDGLLLTRDTPSTPQSRAPLPPRSYYDIHKDAYKEINSKLTEHNNMVAYVEKWEQIVTKRVQLAYTYYCKDRISLNHYAKKLDLLIEEDLRNKGKNRPVKERQVDKLVRNQVKFESAQETHDKSGKSLLLLMEEVTLHSWRDAFPLLRKTIQFEDEMAVVNYTHMMQLGRTLSLLDTIGQKEALSPEGRLDDLQNGSPQDIYTGPVAKWYEKQDDDDKKILTTLY